RLLHACRANLNDTALAGLPRRDRSALGVADRSPQRAAHCLDHPALPSRNPETIRATERRLLPSNRGSASSVCPSHDSAHSPSSLDDWLSSFNSRKASRSSALISTCLLNWFSRLSRVLIRSISRCLARSASMRRTRLSSGPP